MTFIVFPTTVLVSYHVPYSPKQRKIRIRKPSSNYGILCIAFMLPIKMVALYANKNLNICILGGIGFSYSMIIY